MNEDQKDLIKLAMSNLEDIKEESLLIPLIVKQLELVLEFERKKGALK